MNKDVIVGVVQDIPEPDAPVSNKGKIPMCPDHRVRMRWVAESDRYVCTKDGCTLHARKLPELATTIKQMLGSSSEEPIIYRGALRLVVDDDGNPYLMLMNQNVLIDMSKLVEPSVTAPELVIPCDPADYKRATEEVKKQTGKTQVVQQKEQLTTVASESVLGESSETGAVVFAADTRRYFGYTEGGWVEIAPIDHTAAIPVEADDQRHIFHVAGSDFLYASVRTVKELRG